MAFQSGPVAVTAAAGRGPAGPGQGIPGGDADASLAEIEGEKVVWMPASGMPCATAQHVLVDAHEAPGSAPAIFVRQVEHHAGIDRHRASRSSP